MRSFRTRQEAINHVGKWWNRRTPEEKTKILRGLPDKPWESLEYREPHMMRIVWAWTHAVGEAERAHVETHCRECGQELDNG